MSKSLRELEQTVREFKALTLTMSAAAGAGHVGGALSGAESLIAVWFDKFNIGLEDGNRDRFFLGPMHFTPGIYSLLVKKGFHQWRETVGYRRFGSPFEGHPNALAIKGWELTGGSLGQALGVAVGCAIAAKIEGKKHWVVTHNSDGELQEGSMWEAILYAGTHGLDNLITYFDVNRIQSYNRIEECSEIEPLADKLRAFGWNVVEINGNDLQQVLDAYDEAKGYGNSQPTAIIGHTVIGKGIGFLEDRVSSHNKAPARETLPAALTELGTDFPHAEFFKLADEYQVRMTRELDARIPIFSRDYGWNQGEHMRVDEEWSGIGISAAFRACMDANPKVIAVTQDSYQLIGLTGEDRDKYRKSQQFLDLGIAEQNMAVVATGLAKEGFIPLTNGYAAFAVGRAYDQLRVSVAHARYNVKYFPTEGLLGGDGLVHEALESVALGYYMPHISVQWPCDSIEAGKATRVAIEEIEGPIITLQERAPKPLITRADTPYQYGIANIIRYVGEGPRFEDAFETRLSTEWAGGDADIAIIAIGSEVAEALRAAWILKAERNVDAVVVNLHTLKPLDRAGILKAIQGCKGVVTVAQQQKGILGNIVSGVILEAGMNNMHSLGQLKMLGIDDAYGRTGRPNELVQHFGLGAEHIAVAAMEILESGSVN